MLRNMLPTNQNNWRYVINDEQQVKNNRSEHGKETNNGSK